MPLGSKIVLCGFSSTLHLDFHLPNLLIEIMTLCQSFANLKVMASEVGMGGMARGGGSHGCTGSWRMQAWVYRLMVDEGMGALGSWYEYNVLGM